MIETCSSSAAQYARSMIYSDTRKLVLQSLRLASFGAKKSDVEDGE
jgi:hypothetical protein